MNYLDAKDYLRIADNAYNAQAYNECAQILKKVAQAIAFDLEALPDQRKELTDLVCAQINRFQFCPDEALWETVTGLNDLFRKD